MDVSLLDQLCALSKFEFSDEEKQTYLKELDDIINIINIIKDDEIAGLSYDDTTDYESISMSDLREDVMQPSLEPEQLFKNAVCKDNFFVVPKVFE